MKLYGAWVWAGMNLDMFNSLSPGPEDTDAGCREGGRIFRGLGRKAREAFFKGAGDLRSTIFRQGTEATGTARDGDVEESLVRCSAGKELAAALEKLAK
jgi:hypothetical protein